MSMASRNHISKYYSHEKTFFKKEFFEPV